MKILLVDDHAFFRLGIRTVLESSFEHLVLFEAENGEKALEVIKHEILDLIILDLSMPIMDGIELLRYLQKTRLKTFGILALTLYNEPAMVHQLLELGCEGYMPKNSDADDLIRAIKKVLSGELSYPKEFDEKIVRLAQQKKIPILPLSPNEVKIIHLLSLGMTSKEVSVKMDYTLER